MCQFCKNGKEYVDRHARIDSSVLRVFGCSNFWHKHGRREEFGAYDFRKYHELSIGVAQARIAYCEARIMMQHVLRLAKKTEVVTNLVKKKSMESKRSKRSKRHKTSYRGVSFREHTERKHNGKPDRYFMIRYRIDGKAKEEGLGWASVTGLDAKKVSLILSQLKLAQIVGTRGRTLQERRQIIKKKSEQKERT